jgi:hypothetical protein
MKALDREMLFLIVSLIWRHEALKLKNLVLGLKLFITIANNKKGNIVCLSGILLLVRQN